MGKKWIALLLAMLMVMSLGVQAFAEEATEEKEEIVVPPELIAEMGYSAAYAVANGVNPNDIVFYDHVTVGNTTQMNGDFFTDLWGNATSDVDVRNLIHGYNLIRWDGENGMFTADSSVVSAVGVTENAAGDRTYTFVLQPDLRYSDGSLITARDYAFSYLLRMSRELEQAGAVPMQKGYIVGSGNYTWGAQDILSGVHVVANNTIAVTLDNAYLPFFYEMGLLSCNPYPISVIAPGVSVYDDGDGVYLENTAGRGGAPVFSAALLERTINDPVTGYRTHPTVVSGPYTMTSYDGTTAEFTRNPYFNGTAYGEMPLIEKITYTHVSNDEMIDRLKNGEVDILNKVTNVTSINQGIGMIGEGATAMSNYPRSGLSFVAFACENPTVSSNAVRRAIAYCMDRDAIVQDYTGNYGVRIDGFYGVGQWMYGLANGTITPPVEAPENEYDAAAKAAYEKELKDWEAISIDDLDPYALDVQKAADILAGDGWALNADGVREKWVNGQQVKLDLTLLYPEGNRIAESFEKYLVPNLAEAGIKLTLKAAPLADVAATAVQEGARDVDMFYMASNFDLIFDPAVYFSAEPGDTRAFTRLADRALYDRALAMRETEPGEVLEYMQAWVGFQKRFNEQLPAIPIYSNVYFDFFTDLIHDYDVAQSSTWSEGIIGAVKAEIPAVEEEAGGTGDDMVIEG